MQLKIESLSFFYPGSQAAALADINLEAYSGELLVIIGGNGSGKSTLLSCMAGLIPELIEGKYTGSVLLDSNALSDAIPETRPGFVLQESEAYLFSQVQEEIAFPLQNAGIPFTEVNQRVEAITSLMGIRNLLKRDMASLSGGEKQKVAICTALVNDSPLLLLDEPLEQLDPDAADDLLQLLRKLADQGRMIIMTTRSYDYLDPYADRAALISAGRLIAVEDKRHFKDLYKMMPDCMDAISGPQAQLGSHVKPGDAAEIILSTKGLTHTFNTVWGIKDINLEIATGQIIAVMGPNGAGKSTLIKHFIGLLKAQKGQVLVLGQDPQLVPVAQMAQNIGILFQNPDDQIFNERIDKEVAWSLKASRNYSWPQALAESQEILEAFGLDHIKSLHPYSVSRSSRQLIALASVLVKQAELIILDEPGKSLDAANTHSLMSILLSQYRSSTQSIIMVTHDPYLAWSYADQIVLIVDGHLLAAGQPADILSNPVYTQQAKLSKHPFIKRIQDNDYKVE